MTVLSNRTLEKRIISMSELATEFVVGISRSTIIEPEKHGLMPDLGEIGNFSPSDARSFSDHSLFELLSYGDIVIDPRLDEDQIQPATVELRVGKRFWEFDAAINSASLLDKAGCVTGRLEEGEKLVCKPGHFYVFQTLERLKLPPFIEGISDAKSSIGRLGTLVHGFSEDYTRLTHNYFNELKPVLFSVEPLAFPIEVVGGESRLFQILFRDFGSSFLNASELQKFYGEEISLFSGDKLVDFDKVLLDGGLKLTLDTKVAYESCNGHTPINPMKKAEYDPRKHFSKLNMTDGILVIKPNTLYLVSSRERIKLGNQLVGRLSREVPYAGYGLMTHLAGIINPGNDGLITMELFSTKRMYLSHGQPIGHLFVDKLSTEATPYSGIYQNQEAPQLPKQFSKWEEDH